MKVRFLAMQATGDGLKIAGDVAEIEDGFAARLIEAGRAEKVRPRGRPPKETADARRVSDIETR